MNINEIIKMISFKIESDKTAYVWINKENAQKLLKEIERLNNIIDELEKAILNTYPCMNMYEQDFKTELLNILNKLKEGKK